MGEVEGITSYQFLDADQKLSPWASSLVIVVRPNSADAAVAGL